MSEWKGKQYVCFQAWLRSHLSFQLRVRDPGSPDSPTYASTRFFQIPELVEMTLLQVPALQILVIQRTNKTFFDTVEFSLSIQRKLFFKHDPNKSDVDRFEGNPFLSKFGSDWFSTSSKIHCTICTTAFRRHEYPTASWKKMLVSSPVRKQLVLLRLDKATDWCQTRAFSTGEDVGGVKMSRVADHEWENEGDLSVLMHMGFCMDEGPHNA